MRKLIVHTMLALVWSFEALVMVIGLSQVLPTVLDEQPSGEYGNLEWWVWVLAVLIVTFVFYTLHAMLQPIRDRYKAMLK